MIQQTTALRKVASLKKKIRVIRGGQGAGKTVSILILLINHASSKPNREILIISAELTKMRLTVIKDFVKVMQQAGIYQDHRFIAGTLYRFPNGSFIKFIGLDKDDVGKGLRSHVAYFNEVNKCDFESYRQVATRAQLVFADYNPDAPFFIDKEVLPRTDVDFLQLTFMDNELLPQGEREEILMYRTKGYNPDGSIKNDYWANIWRVYGLGEIGNLQGVVFSNWQVIDSIPEGAKLKGYGLDFGYTNDPTALVGIYEYEGQDIWDEKIYRTGLKNADRNALFVQEGVTPHDVVYADRSAPESIAELRGYGWYVMPYQSQKIEGITFGISLMQDKPFFVTKRSFNIIHELNNYTWRLDKEGNSTNQPIETFNHALDAARYYYLSSRYNQSDYLIL